MPPAKSNKNKHFCMKIKVWLGHFFLLSLFFLPLGLLGHSKSLDFKVINIEQGLSQNTIYSILQDHKGFLWIATNGGLNRYNGYSFKTYTSKAGDTASISNSRTISLLEDGKNRLWIGTIGGGLNRYIWETDSFISYRNDEEDSTSLSNDRVMVLAEDPSGKIWVGTADGGLNLFDPEEETFKSYKNTVKQPNLLPSNVIRSLYVDSSNKLWIGTDSGVALYDSDTDSFSLIELSNIRKKRRAKVIRGFLEDNDQNLWIATDDEGLICYNKATREVEFFLHNPNNPNSIPSNTVHDLFLDDEGFLWIATHGGLSSLNLKTKDFDNFSSNIYNPYTIGSNHLRTIFEDSFGVMWIGTEDNGLSKTTLKSKPFEIFASFPGNDLYFGVPTVVTAIHEDKRGGLWIGTNGQGVAKYDAKSDTYEYFKANPHSKTSLSDNHITSIAEDSFGNLWFSTNDGLSKYSPQSNSFKQIRNIEQSGIARHKRVRYVYVDKNDDVWTANLHHGLSKLCDDERTFKVFDSEQSQHQVISQIRQTVIFEDSRNNFWIGSSNQGLILFDRDRETIEHIFRADSHDSTAIISNRILTLFEDSKKRLWIGTADGLSKYRYDTKTFLNFTAKDGVPNEVINGIEEDDLGRLWMSTNYGVTCFTYYDSLKFSFRNYDKYDGLPSNEFTNRASSRLANGDIAFGSFNSYVTFNPSQIKESVIKPGVHLSEMLITEIHEKDNGSDITRIILTDKDNIPLNYWQNNIEFHASILHFTSPEKNGYRYMLEGFDETWTYGQGSEIKAKYTNLKPGTYTFKVFSYNSEGECCTVGHGITIIISPPFWLTWTFYLLLLFLFILFIYVLISLREGRLIKRTEELENLVTLRTQELSSKSETLRLQTESLHKANEEINAKSKVLEKQNKALVESNKEIILQRNELEEQKNSLANLAWSLQDSNEEVTMQRNEVTKQRNEIERQKSEITDSIMYANRIQQAILPSTESITRLFPEHFILNKPKSIVSGDFYWTTRVGKYRIFAVVDCTGHGVPGGFMSMLGVLLLNEIVNVKKIVDPAEILNRMREGIISLLHQTGDSDEASDGMDLSLCIINDDTKELTYSGANSVMFIYKKSNPPVDALMEIRSERMPVGHHLIMTPFTNRTIQLEEGDALYLYTDGIIDQFGGPHGKKFQPNNLRLFILENHKESMAVQGEKLKEIFNQWKGEYFQVDDVLVMGVRI